MLLTLLSVFRVMPAIQKPKFSTITSPFAGESETLENDVLVLAIRDLGVKLNMKDHSLIKLESAGPHGRKSTWASNADLVALTQHPETFKAWQLFMRKSFSGYLIERWVTCLSFIALPFAWMNERLTLGRTAVVLDQAGKGRLVAITNYWIQLALKPLHKAIFNFLRTISDLDGTFDQSKPLDVLTSKKLRVPFSCFDLSAATDRLPVKLQAQILNIIFKNKLGDEWMKLLDISWTYKNYTFKYSVGQPMGAYSSWAMLALTHHVIVRVSALRCGLSNFSDYAVLGDDIVIQNNAVAKEYVNLLGYLGLSINMSKSVISEEFAEFAKVLKGPFINYTPVGPGLILRYIRDRSYLGSLVANLNKLGIVRDINAILNLLTNSTTTNNGFRKFASLWSTIGPGVANKIVNWNDVSVSTEAMFQNYTKATLGFNITTYFEFNALRQLALDDVMDSLNKVSREVDLFNVNWKTSILKTRSLRVFDLLVRLVSPSYWVYWLSFYRDIQRLREWYRDLNSYSNVDTHRDKFILYRMKGMDVTSIDWRDKALIKDNNIKFKKFLYYCQCINALQFHAGLTWKKYDSKILTPSIKEMIRQWPNTLKALKLEKFRFGALVPSIKR